MHILLIHQAFAALNEAGGTRHIEMARALVKRGHVVTIIASPVSYLTGKTKSDQVRWVEKECPETGITILRTYTYKALHRNFIHRVMSFFSFMFSSFWIGLGVPAVDVVWGTSPPIFQGFTAWLLARLKGAKFLMEIRDLWPAFAIAVGVLKSPIIIRMSLWLERFIYTHCDQLIVNSPGFIPHVSEHGGSKILVVPNGADPEMFDPEEKGLNLREKYGWVGKFVVLYAGAHGMSNDLGVVLRAADLLREQANIAFALVGDGKEKANLMAEADRLELPNVTFMDSVPKIEMGKVLGAADACIAILKPLEMYKTTYPNKVFDYMAAGRAVILAIDGVSREIVEAAGAGVFVPPGDAEAMATAVKNMAERPDVVREMGRAGRRYIETHLRREDISNQLAGIFEDLIKR